MDTPVDSLKQIATDDSWTPEEAEEQYYVSSWSGGFFSVGDDGHVIVKPIAGESHEIDISDVVERLQRENATFPILLRFQDILASRVRLLNEAFRDARELADYENKYVGVYPIKVNQLHEVVEEILEAGKPYDLGLECGSKAELVAAVAHLDDDDRLLICNGYKDEAMLRLVLSMQRLGKNVIPVIEKYGEFDLLLELAEEMGVRPRFGLRVRMSTRGSGKWADSGGDFAKFGVSVADLMRMIDRLKESDLLDAFRLLHFHLGSQITDIQALRSAVREITQIYAQLIKLGANVGYVDVGGGLGVNYNATFSYSDQSINYSLQEYANAVIYSIKEVCEIAKVPHPIVVSESGRALTAHHSVLIVDVQGAHGKDEIDPDFVASESDHHLIQSLYGTWKWVNEESTTEFSELLEAYHDVVEKRAQADSAFSLGYLSLEQKALAERLFWSACVRLNEKVYATDTDQLPPELDLLDDLLIDQYLCNFSVFQSMLDYWAIGQRFPIMPIDRLDERPSRRAVLVDLTCDSDGKVNRFISGDPEKDFLELHALRDGEQYRLGFFLMGAYQDIMGDMHNLFGRVPEVHVYADAEEDDGYYIEKLIPGATVEEMLAMVQYFPNDLHRRMNDIIRQKMQAGTLRPKAGIAMLDQYKKMFADITYYRNQVR